MIVSVYSKAAHASARELMIAYPMDPIYERISIFKSRSGVCKGTHDCVSKGAIRFTSVSVYSKVARVSAK